MLADTVLRTIGNTPQVRTNRLFGSHRQVCINSERGGALKPGATTAEPTPGHANVCPALGAAVRGGRLAHGLRVSTTTSGNATCPSGGSCRPDPEPPGRP